MRYIYVVYDTWTSRSYNFDCRDKAQEFIDLVERYSGKNVSMI